MFKPKIRHPYLYHRTLYAPVHMVCSYPIPIGMHARGSHARLHALLAGQFVVLLRIDSMPQPPAIGPLYRPHTPLPPVTIKIVLKAAMTPCFSCAAHFPIAYMMHLAIAHCQSPSLLQNLPSICVRSVQDMLASYPEQWFNTSGEAGEVSPNGLPYAFFPQVC